MEEAFVEFVWPRWFRCCWFRLGSCQLQSGRDGNWSYKSWYSQLPGMQSGWRLCHKYLYHCHSILLASCANGIAIVWWVTGFVMLPAKNIDDQNHLAVAPWFGNMAAQVYVMLSTGSTLQEEESTDILYLLSTILIWPLQSLALGFIPNSFSLLRLQHCFPIPCKKVAILCPNAGPIAAAGHKN